MRYLETDARRYPWVAATVGANSASGYQLATDDPVMAIGGFNGTDPAPTLAQFEQVRPGEEGPLLHRRRFRGRPRVRWCRWRRPRVSTSDDADRITSWVESHFTARTVGGVTVYDLSSAASG